MVSRPGEFKFGIFLAASGYHMSGWRHHDSMLMEGIDEWVAIARMAEAAKIDMLFLADGLGSNIEPPEIGCELPHAAVMSSFEPITLLSALANATTHIGLAATASTTYTEPYNLARLFASLDHISNGRAGWNIVTTHQNFAAENFSQTERMSHDDRYSQAEEYVDVVRGLWDSWDDDAFIYDRASGRSFEPSKMHVLNHVGKHFHVRGPLNLPRSPQGHPVLLQAGTSGPGRSLAARVADVVFCAHNTIEQAVEYYTDLKARVAKAGRNPDDVYILPGMMPVIGRTEAEAKAKWEDMRSLVNPVVALHLLSIYCSSQVNFVDYPLDGPVPEFPQTEGNQGRQAVALDIARRKNLTLRDLALEFSDSRGHLFFVGTAEQVADQLEECYERRGADGFNLLPALLPNSLKDFHELLAPELRRRGRMRQDYTGTTLRDHFNLRRPALVSEPKTDRVGEIAY